MFKKLITLFTPPPKTTVSHTPSPAPASQVYFSPGDTCTNTIIKTLQSAKKTVDICVFTISDDRISKEIVACHKRNVKVRIVTDNEKLLDLGSDIQDFVKKGLAVKVDNSTAHLHHKFAIIDESILINGSFNWTRSAAMQNQENIVISYEKSLIRSFLQEFERLWKTLEYYKN
jgi:mitochondrial cardiolipin hydrolase